MNKQLKLDKKIHRKYEAKHWWQKDYKENSIKINQNYINKIFKKFNSKGIIIQTPSIEQISEFEYIPHRGIIKGNFEHIKNKSKFNKYMKLLDIYMYDIYIDNDL